MRPLILALLLLPSLAFAQQQYDPMLVPFDSATVETPGARWHADLWVRNGTDHDVNLFPERCHSIVGEIPCTTKIIVPARRTIRLDVIEQFAGIYLYVPSHLKNDIHFSLRIRDLNRGADQIGTEIPVVSLRSQMKKGKVTIINVPLLPNGKVDLRIYTDLPVGLYAVRLFAEPSGQLLSERVYHQSGSTDPVIPPLVPLMVDASSIFRGWVADQVRVEIESATSDLFWPLLTITNQRNNQITVVSPQ
ncbi:MAG TPA: hypothetical protein VFM36_00595 [Thermoanaerobaculia bacterium]|nr:hypothetical protein [Thermoanaerobaculia bacterium]